MSGYFILGHSDTSARPHVQDQTVSTDTQSFFTDAEVHAPAQDSV